jgi:hypothetical protein
VVVDRTDDMLTTGGEMLLGMEKAMVYAPCRQVQSVNSGLNGEVRQ